MLLFEQFEVCKLGKIDILTFQITACIIFVIIKYLVRKDRRALVDLKCQLQKKIF